MTRYTVIGAGAVGLLYGGRLQQAGHAVTWVVPSAAEQVRTNGIVIDAGGTTTSLPAEVVAAPADAPAADVVLVALKTTANDRLAELVGPAVAEGVTVAMFQNGLGVEDDLRRAVPGAGAVVGALCFVCAHRRAPGPRRTPRLRAGRPRRARCLHRHSGRRSARSRPRRGRVRGHEP